MPAGRAGIKPGAGTGLAGITKTSREFNGAHLMGRTIRSRFQGELNISVGNKGNPQEPNIHNKYTKIHNTHTHNAIHKQHAHKYTKYTQNLHSKYTK